MSTPSPASCSWKCSNGCRVPRTWPPCALAAAARPTSGHAPPAPACGQTRHRICSEGRKRSWIIYCCLVWCERKTLLWLKIYDRLRPNEHADNQYLTCFKNFPRQNIWDTTSINATYINAALMRVASYGFIVGRFPNAFSHQLGCFAIFCRFLDICSFY